MPAREEVDEFRALGVHAFTTTREAGSFNTLTAEPVEAVMGRWYALAASLRAHGPRFATARQVHGADIVTHATSWRGWLRAEAADGHFAATRGTAMAVTIADCVPVFVAHPGGATAMLHSGWRGTAAGILARGVAAFTAAGMRAGDLLVHLGPAICGRCYEVSPDVYAQLTGRAVDRPSTVDLRELLAAQAAGLGVGRVTASAACTRCDNDRFFSHRAGDEGRQLGVIVAEE